MNEILENLTYLIKQTEILEADATLFTESLAYFSEQEIKDFSRITVQNPELLPILIAGYLKKLHAVRLDFSQWERTIDQEIAQIDSFMDSRRSIGINIAPDALDKLRRYYLKNSNLAAPAIQLLEMAERLLGDDHPTAAHVFSASSCELMIKNILLRPLVSCSIGYSDDEISDLIADNTLGQTGYSRYQPLLSAIFKTITQIDLNTLQRLQTSPPLLKEALAVQIRRNKTVHQGMLIDTAEAKYSLDVAAAVYRQLVCQVFLSLGLYLTQRGRLIVAAPNRQRVKA